MHPYSHPNATAPPRSSSPGRRHRRAYARHTTTAAAAASMGTVLKIAAGLNLLCQHVPSVNALVPCPGTPARTFGSVSGGGHSTDAGVSRPGVDVGAGAWRVARRQGIDMRSTLSPPGGEAGGGGTAVLERNDGGTQTVREMSEQMSQVRGLRKQQQQQW